MSVNRSKDNIKLPSINSVHNYGDRKFIIIQIFLKDKVQQLFKSLSWLLVFLKLLDFLTDRNIQENPVTIMTAVLKQIQ